MTGYAAGTALPSGSTGSALPRACRSILVLGGLVAGFWLIGLLFGSSHAAAKTTHPVPSPLQQQLQRTTAHLVGTVEQVTTPVRRTVTTTVSRSVTTAVTEVAAPVRASLGSAQKALTTISATVTRPVVRPVTVITQRVVHRAAAPLTTTPRATHRTSRTPAAARPAVARPVADAPVAPASVTAQRHSEAGRGAVHVNRAGGPAATPSAPVAPAAPATPSPAVPAAATAGSPDLSALPLFLASPPAALGRTPALAAVPVTGLRAEEPSFSPD